MRYWLLTSEYPPQFGGGILVYCYHTACMLAQLGHAVTVLVSLSEADALAVSEEQQDGIRVLRFGPNQRLESACLGADVRQSFDSAAVLADLIQREGPPDVLESQEYLGMAYFVMQRRLSLDALFQDLPVLVTMHTPHFLCNRYNQGNPYSVPQYWFGEMERFIVRAADALVFPSRYLRQAIAQEQGVEGTGWFTVPHPYQPKALLSPTQEDGEPNGFLFVGRLEPRKGVLRMLEYFRPLWEDGLDQPLYLVGGDYYDTLRSQSMSEYIRQQYGKYMEYGLLSWEGVLSPEALKARLRCVRRLILPSFFENFPYTVLEAMAEGCQVLVSSSGGHAEIVQDGLSGFVFSHDSPVSFAEKIDRMIHLTAAERERMAQASKRRVQELSSYESVAPLKLEVLEWTYQHNHADRIFPFLRGSQRHKSNNRSPNEQAGLLSIVVPFFNTGAYLQDTLDSLEHVDYLPREVVVIDDGSDDPDSITSLDSLQKRYDFRLVRQSNQGPAGARNTGAKQAHGEFLAFLDSDDLIDPAYYQRAVSILRYYDNVSFVGCWSHYFDTVEGHWPAWNPEPPYILVHNTMVSGGLVYLRADYIRFGMQDLEFEFGLEDYDGVIRMLENGCRGVVIPEAWLHYRVRPDTLSYRQRPRIHARNYNWIAQKHARLYQEFAVEVVGLLNANGPGYLCDNPTWYYPEIGFLSATQAPELQPLPINEQTFAISNLAHLPPGKLVTVPLSTLIFKVLRRLRKTIAAT